MKSDLNSSFKKIEIKRLQSEIKIAPKLPERFIEIYGKIHSIISTTNILIEWGARSYNKNCPCLDVASISWNLRVDQNRVTGNHYVLAWKLEKELSQIECLNYLVTKYDFSYNNKGIYEASRFYFDTELDSLNTEQSAILILMMENPLLYNPQKNPKRVKKELEKLTPLLK